MIRKALIVVLTISSLWTVFCWGLSYAPKAGATWFTCGSVEMGKQVFWNVYQGESYLYSSTYDEMGRHEQRRSYNPPPIWVFLLLIVAYPAIAFACGPFRRWRRRSKGLCVACGWANLGAIQVCSACGVDVGCSLRMTSSMWFTFTAFHAAIMLFAAFALVMVGASSTAEDIAYSGAVIFVMLSLAAPPFGLVWAKMYTRRYNKRHQRYRYCSTCQYDLTGNVSGVCPECGRSFDPPLRSGSG